MCCDAPSMPPRPCVLLLPSQQLILYPTAIGSEPQYPTVYSCPHWMRAMQRSTYAGPGSKVQQYPIQCVPSPTFCMSLRCPATAWTFSTAICALACA